MKKKLKVVYINLEKKIDYICVVIEQHIYYEKLYCYIHNSFKNN